MKRKVKIVFFLSLLSTVLQAQTHNISSPRFVRPLVEKWVSDYAKVEPNVSFKILNGCGCSKDAELSVMPYNPEINDDDHVVYFAEYPILPFTQRGSKAEQVLNSKKLNGRRLRDLFFEHDSYIDNSELTKQEKQIRQLTVYSANNGASVSTPFAQFYQENVFHLRGRRISGDDAFLYNAIAKDPEGVSFNALSNLYDLDSRQLKDNISLVRLNLSKELEDGIAARVSLDDFLTLLQQYPSGDLPTGRVAFIINGNNEEVRKFINWILTKGRDQLNDYGLLAIKE